MNSLIVVVGATGTGKSSLAIEIATQLREHGTPTEIVNADAMQLYRGMDIGTAKVTPEERRGVPHHLLDILDPAEEASVAAYQERALETLRDLTERDVTAILVGGSGLYVSSVLWDFRFPGTDASIRARLERQLAEGGPGQLYERLKAEDSEAAAAIGSRNGRRLVRALEVIELTGEKFGSGLPGVETLRRPTTILGLTTPREALVPRLDERVKHMWASGLLDEVAALDTDSMGVTAARAIGYAQAIAQLDGRLDEAQAIDETAALTRKYARRQVGWFARYPVSSWIDSDDERRVDRALDTITG